MEERPRLVRIIPPVARNRVFPPHLAGFQDRQLATFSPRLRVTAQKWNAAGGEWNAAGGGSLRHRFVIGGNVARPLFGARTPEFVSEIETKQGQ
jgi:hypothetical protein